MFLKIHVFTEPHILDFWTLLPRMEHLPNTGQAGAGAMSSTPKNWPVPFLPSDLKVDFSVESTIEWTLTWIPYISTMYHLRIRVHTLDL